ncbi:MAG: chromate transporter [Dehalococcoidia bacterium]
MPEPASSRPSLLSLTRAFGLIGLTSMGGGRFAFFYHEFVRRRQWLTDANLLESLAISQVLPGPNIGNLAVLLGGRLRRLPGAAIGALAVLAPGALMMLGLSAVYFGGGQIPAVGPVLHGVAAAAAGMAVATALQVGRLSVRSVISVLLVIVTVALVVLGLPTLGIVLLLGAAGTLLNRPRTSE